MPKLDAMSCIEDLTKAKPLFEKAHTTEREFTLASHVLLAKCYNQIGNQEKVVEECEKANKISAVTAQDRVAKYDIHSVCARMVFKKFSVKGKE